MDATTASNIDVFNRHPASWSANTGLYPIEADLIKRYFPAPPARVLDIGCGAGRTTVELAQKGYIVKAIDLAPALLAVVRQRAPESSPEIMNATELAFPEATFDAVIFSFNGIDCVFPQSDRLKVFAEVRRVLRPGGVFYYSSHNGIGHVGRACVSMSLSMWLRSIRFLARQLGNRQIRTGYWVYWEGSEELLMYASSPGVNLRSLETSGFTLGAVRGLYRYPQATSVSLKRNEEALDREMASGQGSARDLLKASPQTNVKLSRLTWFYPHIQYVVFA